MKYVNLFCLVLVTVFSALLNAAEISIGLSYSYAGYNSNLAGKTVLYFSATDNYEIFDNDSNLIVYQGNTVTKLTVTGNQITVDGTGTYTGPLIVRGKSDSTNVKVSVDNSAWKTYRGKFVINQTNSYFKIINKVDMEQYLYSVVPGEIGSSASMEALKAQAVCARTYAQSSIGTSSRHSADGYDLCDMSHCQAYNGTISEKTTTSSAVDATIGIVLKFNNQPITQIYYFANCGGKTASLVDVWNDDIGYLKSVVDRPAGGGTDFCAASNSYNWNYTVNSAQLESILKNNLRTAPASSISNLASDAVIIKTSDVSGRAKTVQISYVNPAENKIVDGTDFRAAVGNGTIKSTLLTDIKYNSATDDYNFTGRGYGHGVGMCQDGAIAMASQGYKYNQILGHYFSGIEVSGTAANNNSSIDTNVKQLVFNPGKNNEKIRIQFNVPENVSAPPVLKVFDLRGRLIQTLDTSAQNLFSITGTKGVVEWDGKNKNGQTVKSGVYLYQIEIGSEKKNGKIIVSR